MSDTMTEIKEYGLEYGIVKTDEKELVKQGYKKLNEDMAARASAIFQYFPSIQEQIRTPRDC